MPQSPKYRVSLKLATKTYTKIAPSITEALEKMEPEHLTKSRGVFKITYNKLKSEIMLFPLPMKRLFVNKTARLIFQKRMIAALS